MTIAIITGASSGLGRAFARTLSRQEPLDELWAVARRRDRLEELKALCGCPVRPVPLDLREEGAFRTLEAMLQAERPEISVLVCAAGFGRMGNSDTIAPVDNAGMIDLNCKAAAAVTLLCRPYLHRGSRVLEISSVSAFCPVPGVNLYAATKAFLAQFAQGLHQEWKKEGITVTAVCPYWIRDTEFIEKAQTDKPGTWRRFPLAVTTGQVVDRALRDSRRGRRLSTPGAVASAARVGSKLLPDGALAGLLDWFRRL